MSDAYRRLTKIDQRPSAVAVVVHRRWQYATDALMQVELNSLVESASMGFTLTRRISDLLDTARQLRRTLGVAQDVDLSVGVSGCCMRRSSSASNIA